MTLGDRVCVLHGGLLQQVAPPQVLYERPANLFVAEFIGSPAMNLVEARLEQTDGGYAVRIGDAELRVAEAGARPGLAAYAGRTVALGIRPEDLEDAAFAPGAERLRATVDIREDMGSEVYLHFSVAAPPVTSGGVEAALEHEGLEVIEARAAASGTPFVARVDRASRAREGDTVELAVDTSRLHFFDPADGAALESRTAQGDETRAAALAAE
jgi:multiple sugar transport system ATP-binding protein